MSTGEVFLGLVPLVGSVGTFILAALAWQQLKAVREQAKQGREQLAEVKEQARQGREGLATAIESSNAAQEAAREARRSRIDDSAPRVVSWFRPLDTRALLDVTRGVVQGGEPSLLEASNSRWVDAGEAFSDPGDRNQLLWYRAEGVFINEGTATARIRLDPAMRFLESELVDPSVINQSLVDPLRLGDDWFSEYLLRPGEAALFQWAAGKSLGQWIDLAKEPNVDVQRCFAHTAISATNNSTVDHYYAEMLLTPLRQSPANSSTWFAVENPALHPTVGQYAPVRVYTAEDETIPPPPWQAYGGQ